MNNRKALIQLHTAVVLFGFTAILGDLIALDAIVLVWWRMLIACGSLLLLRQVRTQLTTINKAQWRELTLVGTLVTAHWITFFASVKLANASIALICYSTSALFTALLYPLFHTERAFRRADLVLGLAVIPGMALVVDDLSLELRLGFWIGILSALLISLFTHLNKRLVASLPPTLMTTVQLGTGAVVLSLILPSWLTLSEGLLWPTASDWIYLLILGLVCTTFGYVLQLKALSRLSAFASNLAGNLEPVYGIVAAYFLLNDGQELGWQFYLGALIIVLAVVLQPLIFRSEDSTS